MSLFIILFRMGTRPISTVRKKVKVGILLIAQLWNPIALWSVSYAGLLPALSARQLELSVLEQPTGTSYTVLPCAAPPFLYFHRSCFCCSAFETRLVPFAVCCVLSGLNKQTNKKCCSESAQALLNLHTDLSTFSGQPSIMSSYT